MKKINRKKTNSPKIKKNAFEEEGNGKVLVWIPPGDPFLNYGDMEIDKSNQLSEVRDNQK